MESRPSLEFLGWLGTTPQSGHPLNNGQVHGTFRRSVSMQRPCPLQMGDEDPSPADAVPSQSQPLPANPTPRQHPHLFIQRQLWGGTTGVFTGQVAQRVPCHRGEGGRVQFRANGAPRGLAVGELRQRVATADIRGGRLWGGGVGTAQLRGCPAI